ncbi:hypothetical protein PYW08_015084 [Mythimna loreyi]|uniref:Uncharacterized protein n=1 Tax=Mythimna loreyi TaxID=667449 RepID=A0ACC2R4D3_9NEOP|nr:hypothetical protein PYW08_015084 [Mythimna loreyi]
MHMNKVPSLLLVLTFCELCSSIKVPVTWDDSARSEVKHEPRKELPVEIIQPQNVHIKPSNQQPVPIEYFTYTAQKPRFAADIAAFHGVQNPQEHYKAYPIKPHTGNPKPALGVHQMLDSNKETFQPLQKYVQQNSELNSFVKPTASNYEIFHPYKAEEPALQALYKDPVLSKIRHDLQDTQQRLQAYEEEAGKPNIDKEEYLESPEKTDEKLFSNENTPAKYEIHKPERRPVYYKMPPRDVSRDNELNKKFKHPWNNQNAKIRPVHYRPLQHHIHNLRQHHGMKYDDERNEYPQVATSENNAEPEEGHDIYEKGREKYVALRNNLDESVNNIVQQNRRPTFQKLELQKQEPEDEEDQDEFIPVKNYAQVRKTETHKHLPKKAAFDDAETYEEIINAPRLREAVKSTKAQIVYSEEGYEDSAYDHAGEQKHASDHEGHGGFLKEHVNSNGLYKIPTVNGKYHDGRGSAYRDNKEHGKKWTNNNKNDEEETENEEYSEDEHEENINAHLRHNIDPKNDNRNRRQDLSRDDDDETDNSDDNSDNNSDVEPEDDNNEDKPSKNSNQDDVSNEHEVGKREINFKVPEIDLNSTLSFKIEDLKLAKLKSEPQKEDIKQKYPYYFKYLKGINKNSPLKYAENLKLIPKKSNGGTEFYDSRSLLECPEVDEEVDPIPEKLKNGENPTEDDDENDDESETKKDKSFETVKKQPRLKGLGDKIDCFKAKYFGENPLDSPFFKEEIISNPEPILAPRVPTYKPQNVKGEIALESNSNNANNSSNKLQETAQTNIFVLLDKLRSDQRDLKETLNKSNEELKTALYTPQGTLVTNDTQQANVYTDILKNIKTTTNPEINTDIPASLLYSNGDNTNATYNFFQKKEEVTKSPPKLRAKRATPFVYEPYKIIRDSQVQDSKKTTTTSNISPLIKQLQSSRVAERVSRSNKDDKQKTNSRTYIDIGRKERIKPTKNENANPDATIVDVSVDQRRGEPRYEIRPANHKTEYTPVENKRAMSVDAYRSHTATDKNLDTSTQNPTRGRKRFRSTQAASKPIHDVSQFVPKTVDTQNAAASNSIKKTVTGTDSNISTVKQRNSEISSDEDSNEEFETEEEDDITPSTTTTTTTPKPSFRRRMKPDRNSQKVTTEKEPDHTTEKPLLKLVTRFRDYKPDDNIEIKEEVTLRPVKTKHVEKDGVVVPKYTEKKKKSHSSTLVTDTQKYGDEDDDEMRKEVDALIGVKTNMDDYMPRYEKEEIDSESSEFDDDEDDDEDEDDDDDDDDTDDDDDESDDDDVDEEKVKGDKDSDNVKEQEIPEPEMTTPEPTKRTLIRTTDAPPTTVATRIHSTVPTISPRNNRPIVTRKKTEIHKEIPGNKSSPHVTQFKQDIKEVEIIKEIPVIPKKKPQKNVEALDLYKDDELAKAINNLGDVEIFGEHIDLDKGPKTGGNYRYATKEDLRLLKPSENSKPLKDAETSQSKSTKHIELNEYTPKRLHGGNLKSLSDINRSRNTGRNSKLIELNDPPVRGMHGGNLKYDNKRRGGRRNEKLIEFDDSHDDEDTSRQDDDDSSRSSGHERMHGGNYRSGKLVALAQNDDSDDIQVKSTSKNTKNAAELLNSFAQAAPILTSTPGYILDPSKRMYYYVDRR